MTETYEDKFKFSVEFVKRWGNLAVRLGLIESTGGIGADYYAWNDRIRFSVDAWNFNSKEPHNENAHAKATVTYSVNKPHLRERRVRQLPEQGPGAWLCRERACASTTRT